VNSSRWGDSPELAAGGRDSSASEVIVSLPRGRVAVIGQRVGYVARGEKELARALGYELLLELE